MQHRIRHLFSRARRDDGFSLIEVVVVVGLLTIVMGALTTPMLVTSRAQKRDANYSYAQEQARTGLDSMVSQVRQATSVLSATPNSIDMDVTLGGTALEVYYECDIPQAGTSYHECLRVQAAQGTTLPSLSTGRPVITNLTNGTSTSPVFTLYPNSVSPYYMTATIDVPASGGTTGGHTSTVVFSDGALMRNLNIGN